ncbi:MAG: Tc toxin subunit A, partial [Beijerinckiaceae bacterium]|nr:Tc toxin subunit A [Beijerinckiaceae bacterium]
MTDTDSLPLNPAMRDFLSLNPDISLQTADFDRPDAIARLKFGSGDPRALLDTARAHQSIAALTSDPELANALYDQNLHSAAAIAALPLAALRARLPTAKQEAPAADRSDHPTDQDAVATLHARAVDVHSRAVHLFTALTSVLSPHAKAQPANHLVASFEAEFGHLPSFAQLFGSQDYIPAPHCQSVLGPSAYFLDLMRVVDENITSNTANTIPPDLALRKRRAGLYTQDLTCAETNTLVPKIAIVNQVVADFLKPVVGDDTDYVIATSVFPANLPINVPLERMRAAMDALGASLPALYTAYRFRGQGDSPLPDEGSILAARLGLSPEQRAITQTPRAGADLAACFGGGAELLAPPVATKATISKTSLTVTGTGFNAAAKPGTILRVGATLRAVVTITSDTSLQCDQAWPDDAKDADGLFYPAGSLSTASLLTLRMHVDDAALNALFTQDLDDTERGAGLDKYLYVNGASSAPGLALITDRTDVSYSLAVIGGLDDARLDRVNRIARLAAITGVPARDLAFALWASGATDFDAAGLAAVAKTVLLARDLSIPVVEAVGLWSVLKTWGRGEGPAPADLFDTIFNATATSPSGGTSGFYRPVYTPNPLFKSDVTTWTLAASDAKGQEIRTWLSTALRVPVKDLLLIAAQVANGASSLSLDVPVLSALWARARLARALGISAPDLLAIMTLAGISRISDPADVAQIATLKRFLDERGFALADLAYIVGGDPGGKTGVVRAKDIAPFLAALRVSAAEWLLSPASFSGPGGADTGARIFDTLAVNKIIDRYGTVLFPDWKLVFAVLNAVFPVSARQFPVPGLISNDQAIAAYNDLVKHKVVLGNGLAYPVDATTDLSFLFPEVTDKDLRDAMIESIRSVLNGITRDVELSIAVCKPALRTQHEGLYGELGVLLQIEPAAAATIVTSGFAVAFPNADPVQLLLTPMGTPEALSPPLVLAGRISFLATLLDLTPADLSDAAAKPRAFGLASLQSLGMADVSSWSDYATLVANAPREAIEQRAVAAYLTKGDVAALAAATGWDPQGFTTLVAALWGSSFVLAPSQLWQVRTCFDLAGIMGTDTGACAAIAAIARAPALSGTTPPLAWTTYKDAAATLTAMLKAKSSGGDWAAISKPVNDRTELARRDGLVALAVWTVAQSSLKIETPRGLS